MSESLAHATAASKQGQVQIAVASKIAKMNAGAERAVADLVEAGSQNLQKVVSSTSSGVGGLVDITV